MKSRTARLGICLLFSVLTIAGAYSQSRSQERTSPSASASHKQARVGLRHELKSENTLRVHSMASNPPTTKIGLLSATQIPAGPGGSNCVSGQQYLSCAQTISPYPAVLGHFKGDGSLEVAAVVLAHHPRAYAISVEMPNGNGTFTPTLTVPVTADQPAEFDPIFVGSLKGDAYDDLVMIHQPAAYEVFLNNRDGSGTFTPSGTPWVTVTTTLAVGGTLTTDASTGCQDLLLVDGGNPGNVWTAAGQTSSGKCTGTFGTPTGPVVLSLQLSASNIFNTVVFGNFSNHSNGALDFAGNAASNNQVNVFINNGSGTSYAATPLTTQDSAYDSCFNAAGNLSGHNTALDLVSANCVDNSITVYVNNGSGTFAALPYFPVFGDPLAVSIADVNNDGYGDVISINGKSADAAVLLGNGSGTLQPELGGFVTGGRPIVPALVTQLNGDKYADLVVPDNEFSFAYLKGNGDGTFGSDIHSGINYYAPTGNGPLPQGSSIASGDFNGDGIPDFVIGNTNNNTNAGITVFLSNLDGTMQPGVNYSGANATANLQYVAVADFNHDGKLDIAATDGVNGGVQIFTGNGDGTFTVGATYPTDTTTCTNAPFCTLGIVAADFNGDGWPDIAVVNNPTATTADVGVILNAGASNPGTFGAPATNSLSNVATEIAAGNLGRGFTDLVVPLYGTSTTPGSAVGILFGSANGTFTSQPDYPLVNGTATYYNPYGVAIGDFGTGHPDLAVTTQDQTNLGTCYYGGNNPCQGIAILLGKGDGTFLPNPVLLPTTLQDPGVDNPIPASVVIADMNGDGIYDLAYTNSKFGTAGILYGQGAGAFYDPVEFPAGRSAYNLAVTDLNGAGSEDVVVAGSVNSLDFSGVTVLMNTGDTSTSVPLSSANPSVVGNSVTFTATVAAKVVSGTPTGTVSFYDGSTLLGQGTLSSGTAGMKTSALAVGSHSITAVYNGDGGANFLPSTSSPLTQVVEKASDATSTPVGSPNPAQPKQTVTFQVAVTATNSPLSPTGIVTFFDGGNAIGTGTLSSGVAKYSTSSLSTGTHNIAAVYGGDSNFNGSQQSGLTEVIGQAGTTTAASPSANPAWPKESVTFTATVASTISGLQAIPTGTVTFKDGSTQIGTGPLSSGKATFTTTNLALGSHSITAVYGGDTNFTGSTSSAVNEVVAVPDYKLASNPSSQTVTAGSSAQYKITLTPSTGYNGQVTFACPSSLPTGVACSFLPNPLTSTGTGPVTSVLTITTTAPSAAMIVPADVNAIHRNLNLLASLSAVGLMGLVLTGDWKKRKLSGRFIILAVIALVMILAWAGCGGGSSSSSTGPPPPTGGTPSGSYPLQLTGTGTAGTNGGSTASHPLPITLVVQ